MSNEDLKPKTKLIKSIEANKLLNNAFWFISGSLACRNQGRSGHRKSPVEWAAVASQTTSVYSCLDKQQPGVHKSWKLNGTVGPIGTCKKPKPGRLDLTPNRALFRHSTAHPLPTTALLHSRPFILKRQTIIFVYLHCWSSCFVFFLNSSHFKKSCCRFSVKSL